VFAFIKLAEIVSTSSCWIWYWWNQHKSEVYNGS